ncbi:hypothetical protein LTS10_007939 [Elasticomyces elasticus]|nr:hypothetical protein LTS10_007939 [Elasticomyces elasticus]
MPITPFQTLDAAAANLKECDRLLSLVAAQLDNNWSGGNAALARHVSNARIMMSQARERIQRVGPEFRETEEYLARRKDAYKVDHSKSEDKVKQLDGELGRTVRQRDGLQHRLEDKQNDLQDAKSRITKDEQNIAERDQTIVELREQLATANRKNEQLNANVAAPAAARKPPPLSAYLDPGSPGFHTRPSADSGFSDGSNNPADHTRRDVASGLLETAVADLRRGDYIKADNAFADADDIIRELPIASQQGFDIVKIAYQRAVCGAETGTNVQAEAKLRSFLHSHGGLHSHSGCSSRQKAHITQLLSRTYVKLGRLDTAHDYSLTAVGQWCEVDPSGDEYFKSMALLVRIFHLQARESEALGMINGCPKHRRDYVRNKYSDLQLPVVAQSAGARAPPIHPDAPQPKTKTRQPPRLEVPSIPNLPTAGSAVSGTTTSSTASKRAEKRKKLPLLFRVALPRT